MKSKIKLSIKQPCDEKWEDMLPTGQGRKCIACDRLIVDYSKKTDQEILYFIKQANGKICGRFNIGQLERNLILEKQHKNFSFWQKVLASVMLFIGVNRVSASELSFDRNYFTYVESRIDTNETLQNNKPILKSDTIELTGKIIDHKTKEAIPFVQISSKEHKVSTQSDINGYFSILLPNTKNEDIELTIIGLGYSAKSLRINTENIIQKKSNDKIYETISVNNVCIEGTHLTGVLEVTPERKWYQLKKSSLLK